MRGGRLQGGGQDAFLAAQLLSLWLITWIFLFGIKCAIAYRDLSPLGFPPLIYDGGVVLSAMRLVLCSAEDLFFCLLCLAAGLVGNRVFPSARSGRILLWFAWCAAGLTIAFAAVNIQHYHVLRRFLNYPLLQFSGGMKWERSIYFFATPHMVAFCLLAPLCAAGAQVVSWALFGRLWRAMSKIVCRPIPILALLGLAFPGSQFAAARWFPPDNREFASSPHLLFIRSCFWTIHFGKTPKPLPSDREDFLPSLQTAANTKVRTFVPKNLIFIVLESVSIPYLQVYGSRLPTTPKLVGMKGRSVVLRNIYANATHTAASGLGLFASRFNDPGGSALAIDHPERITAGAAAWLRRHGFKTYFLAGGDWDYNNLGNSFLSSGFDLARDAYRHWSDGRRDWPFRQGGYDDTELFADAAKCLEEAKDHRFFLMLWTYDSHIPYREVPCDVNFDGSEFPALLRAAGDHRLMPEQATGSERIGQFLRYLAAVRHADGLIASLCEELQRLGLSESTLLVITGDHGDAFGEHGWFCHGHALFEEDVHVPMILVSPRIGEIGCDPGIVGSHIDLWPTLAELYGIPPDPLWQGRSLLSGPQDRRAYFYRPGAAGLREGSYKYLWNYLAGQESLYDLQSDPHEKTNIAAARPELCLPFRRRLRSWAEYQGDSTQH